MIYQVKGISGYCVGCVRVSAGVCGCAQVRASVCKCTLGCMGVHGWTRVGVGVGVCRYGWVGADVHGCVHMCGMNFQNFFWRLES